MNIKVSVIIPLFNRATLIKQTLDSLMAQTCSDWEAIVVDDHSTDESFEIAKQCAQKDIRIKVFKRTSTLKGASACRNEGLEKAESNYIIFLDSDDALAPFCIENRLKKAKEHPACDFWIFYTLLFENTPGDMNTLLNIKTEENDLLRFLKLDIPWNTSAVMWKKQAIITVGGWDPRLLSWQDWDLHVRALAAGAKYKYFSDKPDSYWRTPADDTIGKASLSDKHWQSHIYLFSKISHLLAEKGKLQGKIRLSMAGLYFWLARIMAKNKHGKQAIKVWHHAFKLGLPDKKIFQQGIYYFKLRNIHQFFKYPAEIYIRLFWKKILHNKTSGTFQKIDYTQQ